MFNTTIYIEKYCIIIYDIFLSLGQKFDAVVVKVLGGLLDGVDSLKGSHFIYICSQVVFLIKIEHEHVPANTRQCSNAGSMLGNRRRRLPDIDPALGGCLVFAGTAQEVKLMELRDAGVLFIVFCDLAACNHRSCLRSRLERELAEFAFDVLVEKKFLAAVGNILGYCCTSHLNVCCVK